MTKEGGHWIPACTGMTGCYKLAKSINFSKRNLKSYLKKKDFKLLR